MLETLRYSLRNKRIIEIMYHGSQGITQRRVKVLKMDSEKYWLIAIPIRVFVVLNWILSLEHQLFMKKSKYKQSLSI